MTIFFCHSFIKSNNGFMHFFRMSSGESMVSVPKLYQIVSEHWNGKSHTILQKRKFLFETNRLWREWLLFVSQVWNWVHFIHFLPIHTYVLYLSINFWIFSKCYCEGGNPLEWTKSEWLQEALKDESDWNKSYFSLERWNWLK